VRLPTEAIADLSPGVGLLALVGWAVTGVVVAAVTLRAVGTPDGQARRVRDQRPRGTGTVEVTGNYEPSWSTGAAVGARPAPLR